MNYYEIITSSEDWILIEINMKVSTFIQMFKSSISNFYRTLSNSPKMFMNQSYRDFFKQNFSDGLYRHNIIDNDVKIVMFLKSNKKSTIEKLSRELTLRIKKMVLIPVVIKSPKQMSETDKQLLQISDGLKNYRKILSTYQKGSI